MRRDEEDVLTRFAERYAVERGIADDEVERAVIGGDWGANGYSTRSEVDSLSRDLGLGPGRRLLDIGAGRGWPGLYLAATTGCEVVLVDLPAEGLAVARARAEREDISERVRAVVARADGLPLRAAEVDAVVHTDVLC